MLGTVWQEALALRINITPLFSLQLYIQWCDDATAAEVCLDYLKKREKSVFIILTSLLIKVFFQITRPRYSSPYSWPLSSLLAYQKQWEVRRKMNAIGWGGKTLEQVRNHFSLWGFTVILLLMLFYFHAKDIISWVFLKFLFQVYEDVSQCCQALSQRLGTQPFFFNKQ